MRYNVLYDHATLEYQYPSDCFMWRWPDRELHVWSLEREFMYFAGKLVNLIILPSNQLAVKDTCICEILMLVVALRIIRKLAQMRHIYKMSVSFHWFSFHLHVPLHCVYFWNLVLLWKTMTKGLIATTESSLDKWNIAKTWIINIGIMS